MPRKIFLNSSEDMKWFKEVHLSDLMRAKSAVVEGNEDASDKVTLYWNREPEVGEKPIAIILFP